MRQFEAEARIFADQRQEAVEQAGQLAAAKLICGIDLPVALAAPPAQKNQFAGRLRRAIERERLKGMSRHWSYDLNRHIALKQVLDRLLGTEAAPLPCTRPRRPRPTDANKNGARKRR